MALQGNAAVGQSGGCTAVINQSMAGLVETARHEKRISNLWGLAHGIEGLFKGELLDLRAQPPALLRRIAAQPSAALGSSRHKLREAEEFQAVKNLRRWNIRYLFLIGGNDTAQTVLRIARAAEKENYELRAAHIPKTIDNDLARTDHCPGYGSVARFAAVATQEAALDSRAMRRVDRVKIIELMGRNAGWIVAASALLKNGALRPPHLLYLPEIPFDEAVFLRQVDNVLAKAGYCVAVISETIRDPSGTRVGARREGVTHDPFGHPYVEGAAAHLARLVEQRLKVRARFDKPGTIARMSIPYASPVDQKEAYAAGAQAVRWTLAGKSRFMVAFVRARGKNYKIRYAPVPVEKIAGVERRFPASFLNAQKNGVNESFVKYALPLLGPRLPGYPTLKLSFVSPD
jgi:6-phosphofructokinase 1